MTWIDDTFSPPLRLLRSRYRRDVMAILNMVRDNMFGELIHVQAGYQHDLRGVKFNSGNPALPYERGAEFGARGWSESRWRTAHSVDRNADLYPSHGIGPAAMEALRPQRRKRRPRRHGFFVVHAFIEALKADATMPIDIYDAVAWSAITPLSEQSIKEGNRTLDFPDFTTGKWATHKPDFALSDRY